MQAAPETDSKALSQATSQALFQRIHASFLKQGLMQHLGVRLLRVEPGICAFSMPYSDRVTQHRGGFHGGAMGALADITGGFAAMTVIPLDMDVTSVEYKINFMASFSAGELIATGRIVKAGKRIIIATAEIVHHDGLGNETICALMQQTLMAIPAKS